MLESAIRVFVTLVQRNSSQSLGHELIAELIVGGCAKALNHVNSTQDCVNVAQTEVADGSQAISSPALLAEIDCEVKLFVWTLSRATDFLVHLSGEYLDPIPSLMDPTSRVDPNVVAIMVKLCEACARELTTEQDLKSWLKRTFQSECTDKFLEFCTHILPFGLDMKQIE